MSKEKKSQNSYTFSCDKIYTKYGKIVTMVVRNIFFEKLNFRTNCEVSAVSIRLFLCPFSESPS